MFERCRPSRLRLSEKVARLAGAFLLAVILPFATLYGFSKPALPSLTNALAAEVIAILAADYFLSQLIAFPGSRATSYILPTLSAAWGAILTAFLLLRLDYARFPLFTGFITSTAWYYAVHFAFTRTRSRKLGVVPIGRAKHFAEMPMPNVSCLPLLDPSANTFRLDAIVADFRAALPQDWERFIAEQAIAGMPVFHVKQIEESIAGRVEIEHLSENNFGSLIPGMAYIRIKQIVDFVAALIVGIILLPALIVVGNAIRLSSPGTALVTSECGPGPKPTPSSTYH